MNYSTMVNAKTKCQESRKGLGIFWAWLRIEETSCTPQCDLGVLSPALLPMRRDRHSAECSSNGKQALHFPRNAIENTIENDLAIALEHEHAKEWEGSHVKSTSKPKFAHACAESVLPFAFNAVIKKLLHARCRSCRVLHSRWRSNKTSTFENTKLLMQGDNELLHHGECKNKMLGIQKGVGDFLGMVTD